MFDDIKNSFKGVLDFIPVILVLGIILGFGAYITLFGACLASILALILNRKSPLICASSILFIIFASYANAHLGGSLETLFAMLFLASLFIICITFFNFHKKIIFNPNKILSKAFLAAVGFSSIILSIPLVMGNKTCSSLYIMADSISNYFSNANENSIIIALTVLGLYYYLVKMKTKFLPPLFLSVLGGAFVNFLYKMNSISALEGFSFYSPFAKADFGNFLYAVFFSFLIAVILIIETKRNLLAAKKEDLTKRFLYLTGASNILSSMTGMVSGGTLKCASKSSILPLISVFIFLIFAFLFKFYASFVPVSCLAMALIIKGAEILRTIYKTFKKKNLKMKSLFILCFLISFYNIISGIFLIFILTLILNRPKESIIYDKEN